MSFPLFVAFIWHQHQPLYKTISGKYQLPWVRLHGVKDYLDLVLMLEKFPKLHQTVNLVPSLITQLQDYIDGTAFDPYLELALTPAENLNLAQRRFVAERFFDANHHTMVEPYPRYAQLLRQQQEKGINWCLANWQIQDYADLMAWHNLTWFDPLFREADLHIQAWFEQGSGFTLSDRQRIYSKQKEIIARILPQHRKMQDTGQLEITTTPYTHPIMPLLADTKSGRVADPQMLLPGLRFRWESDITLHLEKAKQIYDKYFGKQPKGLWPSEQSVSPAILPHVAKQGFSWLCSDEEVLGWSLGHYFRRDEHGYITEPHLLYQPYRLETVYGDLAIAFRDHRLSDLIGFSYSSMSAEAATNDLCQHLKAIHHSYLNQPDSHTHGGNRPWLVTIALDGENCWENYPQDGKIFLETLYARLSQEESFRLVTVSEFIKQFPPIDKIPPHQLHSGSWIDANFSTWIGDPVKNRAWELLAETRQVLANHPEATQENNSEAWEHMFAAEGSDWFWWFGEGHSSNLDHVFDQLFREHLQAVYRALNEAVPTGLLYPLEPHDTQPNQHPKTLIHPVIDGRNDEQSWIGAGRIEIAARSTMHHSGLVKRLWYGCDHFNLYLRLDFGGSKQEISVTLHLCWFYPERTHYNSPILITNLPDTPPLNYLFHHHLTVDLPDRSAFLQEAIDGDQWQNIPTHARIGLDQCLEMAVPWSDLKVKPESATRLVVLLSHKGQFQASLPENTIIPIEVP